MTKKGWVDRQDALSRALAGGVPERPRIGCPKPGSWKLALWNGADDPIELDVQDMQFSVESHAQFEPVFTADGRVFGAPVDGIPSRVNLTAAIVDPAAFQRSMGQLSGGEVPDVDTLAASGAQLTNTPDPVQEALGARLDGAWWIVAGADVQIVEARKCPATHLPAYAVNDIERAKQLRAQVCALGYDGDSYIAPELCMELTIANLAAFSDRLASHDIGEPIPGPNPATMMARAREAARKDALRARMVAADIDPPDADLAPIEAQVAASMRFRCVSPDVFIQWAAERGLTAPKRAEARYFPGCTKALWYPNGVFALFYPDHVRVGTTIEGPATPPEPPSQPDVDEATCLAPGCDNPLAGNHSLLCGTHAVEAATGTADVVIDGEAVWRASKEDLRRMLAGALSQDPRFKS